MKTQLMLTLYDDLFSGRTVNRADFCSRNGICERTYYRYVNEISEFLRAKKPDYVLDVIEFAGDYYLKKTQPKDAD